MWEATFLQHFNSAKDIFNISDDEDYDKVKAEVIKLLRMKYSLEIICENPLKCDFLNRPLIDDVTISAIIRVFNSFLILLGTSITTEFSAASMAAFYLTSSCFLY